MLRIGISGVHEQDAQERQVSRYTQPPTLSASFWFLGGEDVPERAERKALLEEHCEQRQAPACVLKLTPSLLVSDGGPERVMRFQMGWRLKDRCPLYLDPGRDGLQTWMRPEECVSDPLWHGGKVWGDYWRIHGWHPERWVRLYSAPDLRKLAALARRHEPRFLILAHSQRVMQWKEFLTLLSNEAKRRTR